MTDTDHHKQDLEIRKVVIGDQYKADALKTIQNAVHGNQYNPDDVSIVNFEGEILQFQAETVVTVLTNISNKTVPGRLTEGVLKENEHAVNDAIQKDYKSLASDRNAARKTADALLGRDDKGFAANNQYLELKYWQKEYVVHEPCQTCRATGTVKCMQCAGKGTEPCPRCHGSGMRACHYCNGSQMVMGPNQQMVQCTTCHGVGKSPCDLCAQKRTIQCKNCAAKGVTACPNCQGNAWSSNLTIVNLKGRTAFDYPKDRLPDKIVAMIEKHGVKIREHAEIEVSTNDDSVVNVDDEEKLKQEQQANYRGDFRVPVIYDVSIPNAHIEFEINGKSYYTFLFGTQGRLTHVSNFLDDLIKEGLRKLDDAVQGRGDVTQNLIQAAQYKTIRQGIQASASKTSGRAKMMLKKANRLGLSQDVINQIIKNADRALKVVTKKPRQIGVAAASLFQAALYAIYFLSPVRAQLVSKFPAAHMQMALDGVILFFGFLFGYLVVQVVAQSAMNKIMSAVGIKQKIAAKLGNAFQWLAGLSVGIFLVMVEITRHMGAESPAWYAQLFS